MVYFREIIPKWPKNSGMAGGQEKWCGQKNQVSEICFFNPDLWWLDLWWMNGGYIMMCNDFKCFFTQIMMGWYWENHEIMGQSW